MQISRFVPPDHDEGEAGVDGLLQLVPTKLSHTAGSTIEYSLTVATECTAVAQQRELRAHGEQWNMFTLEQ